MGRVPSVAPLWDRVHLVIDGVDGRVHHVELGATRAEDIGRGMIVEAVPAPGKPRPADRNILSVTDENGIYRPSEHLQVARDQVEHIRADPDTFVKMHVRPLEALRRTGIVERIDADHWRVPDDLPERGLAHDLARDGADAHMNTLSPIGLERQVSHEGATWLDRELVAKDHLPITDAGFGREVNAALDRRAERLVEMGHATIKDDFISIPRRTVAVLERQEVERVGREMAAERGVTYAPSGPGEYVSGPTGRGRQSRQRALRHD